VIAILIGLMAGLAVWGCSIRCRAGGGAHLRQGTAARLDLRSRESLLRFDQYMANYAATARLLANHRRLAQYLEPLFWFPEEDVEPIVYEGFRPFWLPDFFGRNALLAPSHVLLMDSRGRVREIYQAGDLKPLPEEMLAEPRSGSARGDDVRTVLTRSAISPTWWSATGSRTPAATPWAIWWSWCPSTRTF
jgi:two-component system sensor kinase FixL